MAGEPGRTILVVDDDEDIREVLRDILGDLSYRVQTACDAEQAFGLLERGGYDIALLDLKLPGAGGLEVLRWIRRRGDETRALILTAFATDATEREAARLGASVLSKPIDVDKLISRLGEPSDRDAVGGRTE